MAKRVVLLLLIVLIVALAGSYAYHRYRDDRRFNGGEVVADDNGKVTADDGSAPVLTRTRSETPESLSNNAPDGTSPAPPLRSPQPAAAGTMRAPTGDTISVNPPNREMFTGTGKFQVYRQGDLTWRLNTETGSTCVLFATLDQWRRPVVYRNACPNG